MCRMPGLLETDDVGLYNKKFLYAGTSTAVRNLIIPGQSQARQNAD